VIAALRVGRIPLAKRGATELPPPSHERVVQQSAFFEVEHERRRLRGRQARVQRHERNARGDERVQAQAGRRLGLVVGGGKGRGREERAGAVRDQLGDGGAGNSRNGYGRKSVVTDTGRVVRHGPSPELLRDPAVRKAYLGALAE
jgi:hypothetical protein